MTEAGVNGYARGGIILEAGGVEKADPTDEDLFRALDAPRDDDWFVTLWRGERDYMEAMLDRGDIWVESQVGGKHLQARSHVDDAALRAMFVAFRDGVETWRDLAEWKEPPARPAPAKPPSIILGASAFVGLVVLAGIGTAIFTGNGGWVVLMFALLLPGLIALAAAIKVAEAQRAAKWTRGSAKIVRSELATEKRHDKEVKVPRVEYEFSVGFHRFRGKRVNFAEVISGADAIGTVARYPVGASVPVYYDPADPNRSVLYRELPSFFRAIWAAVGILTVAILAGGWYFLLR